MAVIRERARFDQVASMDADVMITVAFVLEVFLFALAAAVFAAREARKDRAETERERVEPAEMRTGRRPSASANPSGAREAPRVGHRCTRAVRGVRS